MKNKYTIKEGSQTRNATRGEVKRILSNSLVMLAELDGNGTISTGHFIITRL